MNFIAIGLIDDCIKKTKDFLFPVKKNLWLKLGLVTLFAGGGASSLPNFRLNYGNSFLKNTTIWNLLLTNLHWILLSILGVIILGIVISLISSFFNFILIDSVEKKRCLIRDSFKKTNNLAFSFFSLYIVIYLIFLAVLSIISIPILFKIFSSIGNPAEVLKYPYFWISIFLMIIVFLIFSVINNILFNLVMPDIYYNRISSMKSWKRMYPLLFKEIKQIIVYWIMRLLFSLFAAIIAVIAFLVILLLFLVVAAIIFGIFFLIGITMKFLIIPLVIIGILLGIIMFFLFIYSLSVVLVPIPVFFTNYRLDFYKGLTRKR